MERSKIILVDDNKANLSIGRNMLKTFYEVYPAPSAAKLFEVLDNVLPDLILMDIEMPETNGYEAMRQLKGKPGCGGIPVIFLTSKDDEDSELEGLSLGAVDYVSKPFSAPLLLKRIANHLEMHRYRKSLEVLVDQKAQELRELHNAILTIVTEMIEFRDKQTGGHISRTRRYLEALTHEMIKENIYTDEISHWDMEAFYASAQLHDIGKVAISDAILNKPARLTPEEFEVMKTHVVEGVKAVERILSMANEHAFLKHALPVVGTHHEKWDGTGYPVGLKASKIPLEGRLMAIADVYDALITERPYKKPFTHEDACGIIEKGAGSHFDPVLVEVFRHVKDEFFQISQGV